MANILVHVNASVTAKGSIYVKVKTTSKSLPQKVFAIEVLPASKDKATKKYRLSHVCSPAELEEFPEDFDEESCYFRTDEIEMIFDTAKIAKLVIDQLRADVARLDTECTELYEIITGGTITPDPDDPSLIPNIFYEDL